MKPEARGPIYVPYARHIEKVRGDCIHIVYNGGELVVRPSNADVIMFYGATGSVPLEVLDLLGRNGVPVVIHRKHLPRPMWIYPGPGNDRADLLSCQVRIRDDLRRRRYLSRVLLANKFSSSEWLVPGRVPANWANLSLEALRQREAQHARRYWSEFYERIGCPDLTRRRRGNPINGALDALSMYQAGIILRWTIYHRLSPCHGFLHTQTNYPSLVYDLMEPYRAWIDRVVYEAYREGGDEKLIERSTSAYKKLLREPVYCHLTRQTVARKILLHGVVLALRAYLTGEMDRFLVPVPGARTGGRPYRVSWRMPGGRAGNNIPQTTFA